MAATSFEKVVEMAQALNEAEKWRLRHLLDVWLAPPGPPPTEEELAREMLRDGLLDQAATPSRNVARFESYKAIEVAGKPVSETVIEERR